MSFNTIKVNNTQIVGVDNQPTLNSDELAKSGGIVDYCQKFDIIKDVTDDSDFCISDEQGNVLLELSNGHIRTKNFSSYETSPTDTDKEITLADVYCIPCYGQSLAIDTGGGASTFSYVDPMEVDQNLSSRHLQDMCSGTVEGFRICSEYYGRTYDSNFKIVTFRSGGGGKAVFELQRGTIYYTDLMNNISTAYNACLNAELSMIVPCFTWTQGEEDMRSGGNPASYGSGNYDPYTYKDRLKRLIDQLNEDIKAITGQKQDVYCISYQVSSHNCYFRYPRIAIQQFELSLEDPRMILATACYDVEYSSSDQVHAPSKTYRHMGNLYGIAAYKKFVMMESRVIYIKPIKFEMNGSMMYITFEVPYKPLVLDTVLVNNLPDNNYGFNVYDVNEQTGAAGSIQESQTRISSVELFGDYIVKIVFSRQPQTGERLTYGINGDYWQNIDGSKTVVTGEVDDGRPKSGNLYGSRGCLRDSQPFKVACAGAVYVNTYNWCPIFEYEF